ncbi:MAG TPA: SPFH domain-containing protein [Acidobacteriaceae bacterium]|nr:SPFH domain-containing protein [Acidobacteriaceae bacterium]
MRPSQFVDKQLLDVIQWSEPEMGALVSRYPMLDAEIQAGAWLSVRESEMALFVDQDCGTDLFGPGLYALNPANLPMLAEARNWGKGFASPFKSDIYFFSTVNEFDQTWGTPIPIRQRTAAGGEIRVRGYGSYSYRIADVRTFFAQVSGERESYFVYDLEDRLRSMIVAGLGEMLAGSGALYEGPMASDAALSGKLIDQIRPGFVALGLDLTQLTVQAISLQDELDEEALGCASCGASMRAERGALKCDYCHAVVIETDREDVGLLAERGQLGCPACEIALLQATVGGVSLLYCTRCDGMLVAMDEFEVLVAAARELPRTTPLAAAELRDTYDCPECRRSMGVSFHGGHVAIDSCEDCCLHWLDHRELAQIAQAPVVESASSDTYFNPAHMESSTGMNMSV